MATPSEEITSKPPQPDLSNSVPRHCRVPSSPPHADSSLQEGGLPSDHAHQKNQPISNGRDPRELIKERYDSKLRSQRLSQTCPPLASVADGHIQGERVCPREVRSRMGDHVSRGKFDGLVDDTAINIAEEGETCLPPARPHRSHGLSGNISGEGTSTVHNLVSRGASPSSEFDVLAHEHSDNDVESGHVQFFERTQQVHRGPRWTILGDSLMDVIVQGTFALVGIKMSKASSPVKDMLVRVVVIVYAVGFLSAIGGKLRRSSIMGGIGSAAAVLGFLLTMILLLL